MKKGIIIFLLLFSFTLLFQGNFTEIRYGIPDSSFSLSIERIDSDPITIIGNDDLLWSTFDGDGSEENPFLIENLHIELNQSVSMIKRLNN
ncbi:MAG: hypothetical protein ACFFE2_09545 [Candidatus Thorarchaeota archaeon]